MSAETEFRISMCFNSYETMLNHLKEYGEFLIATQHPALYDIGMNMPTVIPTETIAAAPEEPRQRRENEKRGQHTALYHALARAYREEHPDIPYRECYKLVSRPPPADEAT